MIAEHIASVNINSVNWQLLYDNFVLNRRQGRSLRHKYGPGQGEIWLDDLRCTGTETDLADCRHNGIGQHNCRHGEDISIACDTTYGMLSRFVTMLHDICFTTLVTLAEIIVRPHAVVLHMPSGFISRTLTPTAYCLPLSCQLTNI